MTSSNAKSMQISSVIAAVGIVIATGGLAACGSSSDDKSSTSTTATSAADPNREFDLQAHRGGRGMTAEESLPGFAKAIELGVTTLELDIVLTKDKVPLIWHDPEVEDKKCTDTAPAFPDDPMYPYVGKLLHDLSLDQARTLDCGKKQHDFPEAQELPGNRIATLPELFALVKSYSGGWQEAEPTGRVSTGAFEGLRYNIETKIEAPHPEQSATPQEFVDVILDEVDKAGATNKVEIQSFDWRSLPLVKAKNPAIPTSVLYDDSTFKADSPWLGPIDYAEYKDNPLAAIKALGANIASPSYVNPWDSESKIGDKDFKLTTDTAYVRQAHELGLKVKPWTVNDKATIALVLDQGVDGIITDYPNRAREVMRDKGYPLPAAYRK